MLVVGVEVRGALVLLREVWVSGMGLLSLLCWVCCVLVAELLGLGAGGM